MAESLIFYRPEEARAAWPAVRDRIAALAEDCREEWMAEDVFLELVSGRAFLWGTPGLEGFVILQINVQPWGNALHVWICCNSTEANVRAYWPQIMEIAAQHGCATATIDSARKGWERALPELRVRQLYIADVH